MPTDVSGPIDIQANEQEFAGDQVIAKGNVRVSYKESVIIAPMATLFRDPSGNPQKAIFTGHPRLTQGTNLVHADKLIFEIASQKVVAEGNAHSEVQAQNADATSPSDKGAGISKPAPGERIITDSDRQEYDKSADKFEAMGNVRVKHGEIFVTANKLQLVYGADKKPETAVFTGNVVATQGQNKTTADIITYSLPTKRLQATGHVKSQVIQPRKADGSKKGDLLRGESGSGTTGDAPGSGGIASSGSGATGSGGQADDSSDPIIITSDAQDYSQDTRRMSAEGNVRVYYQDTVGMGPKVILLRNEDGKADKVIFSGRSQVSQPGRRWIADRITVTVADKRVLAEGNTKALIIQQPGKAPNRTPAPGIQLAGRGNAISSRGIEAPQ
jgi:lipopolysaccharide export system protein LptA